MKLIISSEKLEFHINEIQYWISLMNGNIVKMPAVIALHDVQL